MHRFLFLFAAGVLGLTAFSGTSLGYILINVPSPTVPDDMAAADIAFVGKVTRIEQKTVSALPFPGARVKREFKIAVVEIQDRIMGVKETREVRVGWAPPRAGVRAANPLQLAVGQEYLFMLPAHMDGDIRPVHSQVIGINMEEADPKGPTVTYRSPVIAKTGASFALDLKVARHCARLLADPDAGLNSSTPEDPFRTACLLITRYRNDRANDLRAQISEYRKPSDRATFLEKFVPRLQLEFPTRKAEPIDAGQSKRILEALAGADWTKRDEITQAYALKYFKLMAPGAKDGWKPPEMTDTDFGGTEFVARAKKWCRANAATYRVQRLVLEK